MTRLPRLKQPLFTKAAEAYRKCDEDRLLTHLTIAYDALWTMRYRPSDITEVDALANAEAGLSNLGNILEAALGPDAFDQDPRQLTFPDEIIYP